MRNRGIHGWQNASSARHFYVLLLGVGFLALLEMSAKQTKGCRFPEERVAGIRLTGGPIFLTFTLYVAFMWILLELGFSCPS